VRIVSAGRCATRFPLLRGPVRGLRRLCAGHFGIRAPVPGLFRAIPDLFRVLVTAWLACFLPGSCACAQPAPAALPSFIDVTQSSGIRFHHSFGDDEMTNIIESSGSGCAFFDYDNDGWLDLYVVNCGYTPGINDEPPGTRHAGATNRLYRNRGDGTFDDVTATAGCGDPGYGFGCVAGDYDNDGDTDLYVTNRGPNVLYRNNGDATFTDVTLSAGVGDALSGIGCTMFDYDLDGFLDIYVGNYLEFDPEYRLYYVADEFPGPLAYMGQPDVLYRNNGDGTFTDATEAAGVDRAGRAMGVLAADYNGDGLTDLFVANDAMENYLYRNNGDGTFTDVALEAGVAFSASGDATSSMGGDFGDYDNDGDLDLLVPDMAYNNLYLNLGNGFFEDVTAGVGLAEASGQYVSWAGDFADFDNDGYLDILVSNGDAHRLDTMEALLLFNVPGASGSRVFRDRSQDCGPWFRQKAVSRGMAVGDYDNDGDQDVFLVNLDQPSRLIRNDGVAGRHWLMVRLVGRKTNRDGVGARVTVRAGDLVQMAERRTASGYLSQNDGRLHFGLGDLETVDAVEVRWPSGLTSRVTGARADQILLIEEPEDAGDER
jgi:enediyne biosynthesis protein E4